jgi:hypothetical protein
VVLPESLLPGFTLRSLVCHGCWAKRRRVQYYGSKRWEDIDRGIFTEVAGQPQSCLARLLPDGQVDSLFTNGTDGTVLRMQQQQDEKTLVAGGFTNLLGATRHRIGRLLTNGLVDLEFDAGTNFAATDGILAIATQSDGKILVASYHSATLETTVKRLNPDGELDSSFTQTKVFNEWFVYALCPRTNGSILVGGGFRSVNDIVTPGLALLNSNGIPEVGFASPLEWLSTVFSFVAQTNGDILVGVVKASERIQLHPFGPLGQESRVGHEFYN